MEDNKKYNGWANRATWAFTTHITNDEGFYNLLLTWLKDNINRKENKDFGSMFIKEFNDLMSSLLREQELSPYGVDKQGKEYIKLYINMVVDMNATSKEDLNINPVEIKEWLHEFIEQ